MAIDIEKITSTTNTTACSKRTPKYLVLHYTASTRSNSGQAKAIAKMFANPKTGASADFIVDDNDIVQYNPDPTTRYCWAVGGSKYTSLTNSLAAKYYGKATNATVISIEITSSKKSTKTMNATDKDWYFSDAALANALKLAVYLCKKYDIPVSNVITHNMVTGKLCPANWSINEDALAGYKNFKSKLKAKLEKKSTYSGTIPNVVLKNGATGKNVTNLQNFLIWYGCSIKADGDFGDNTEKAVRKFQKEQGLTVNGTWNANCVTKAKKVER